MPRWKLVALSATAVTAVIIGGTATIGQAPTAMPAAAPTTSVSANIEPRADAALKRMSDTLAKLKSFRVHSVATIEEETESGQMALFSRDTTLALTRPNHLQADVKHGGDTRRIWYSGTELTILDVADSRYAVLKTPDSIPDTLDFLYDEYDVVVPMDDLLYPDPYKTLTEDVTSGVLVDQQKIGGSLCDHLLFTQDNVDWQIWIDTAAQALPRRLVITYKGEEDNHRQFEANLDGWQLDPALDAAAFAPQLPAAAKKVDINEIVPLSEEGD